MIALVFAWILAGGDLAEDPDYVPPGLVVGRQCEGATLLVGRARVVTGRALRAVVSVAVERCQLRLRRGTKEEIVRVSPGEESDAHLGETWYRMPRPFWRRGAERR